MSNIWVLREKGGFLEKTSHEPVQLTSGTMNIGSPVPSRDGKKLFVRGGQARGELVRYDAKSGQFVPYLSGISAQGVTFSKDGQWVAYVIFPEGSLWRSKLDGSERMQLSFPPLRAFQPQWSLDGKHIAFMGETPGRHWHIFLVSVVGGSHQQLASGEGGQGDPAWSPDGNSLAYGDEPSQSPEAMSIRVMDLKTHQVSKLPESDGLFSPHWSTDARYIAALRGDSENLMLFDFKTQKWELIAKMNANYLNWSRDGKTLYFDTYLEREPVLYRVRVSDRKLERIVSLKNLRRAFGEFGPWSGLAPDDSFLTLRDTGAQEIYALDWEAP